MPYLAPEEIVVDGDVLVDPYWIWAEATDFEFLQRRPDRIPVLLELFGTVENVAQAPLPKGLELGALHLEPAAGLGAAKYCTGYATRAFLLAVARGAHRRLVKRFEIGLPIVDPSDSAGWGPLGVDLLDRGTYPPVLAVIDDGLPVAHPSLIDAQGKPRCLALWDQDGAASQAPGLLQYGRLLGRNEIEAALARHPSPAGVPRDEGLVNESLGLHRLRRSWTHGAAVLGLAALGGTTEPGPVPPFIGVNLPRRTSDDTSGLSLGVHALDALHFVLKQADASASAARLSPGAVVVNLSFGRLAGTHDGSGMLASAIDEALELRNAEGLPLAVVLPAGNGHLSRCHARGTLQPGARHTLDWRIQPDDRTPSFVELRPSGANVADLTVTLRSPTGECCGPVGPDERLAMHDAAGRPVATVIHCSRSAAGNGPTILLAVAPTFALAPDRPTAAAGPWSIELHNRGAERLRVAAWVQRDDRFAGATLGGRQSYFDDAAYQRFDDRGRVLDEDPAGSVSWVSREETINPIATGRYTVVVGARRATTGEASPYSAASGSHPPQVTAVADDSPARPGIPTHGTRAGTRVRANGTSLAAPQVARWLLDRAPAPAAAGAPNGFDPAWARNALAALAPPIGPNPLQGRRTIRPDRGGAASLPRPPSRP
jgi:hypothetical protein